VTTVKIENETVQVSISANNTTIALKEQIVAAVRGLGQQGPKGDPGISGGGSVPPVSIAVGDAAHVVFEAPEDGVVTNVRLRVTEAFDGTGAQVAIGTIGDADAVMAAADSDVSTAAEYETTPDFAMTEGQTLLVTITPGSGATQGAAQLLFQFTPSA
jgi:hypothetical protein